LTAADLDLAHDLAESGGEETPQVRHSRQESPASAGWPVI
jgi:hypothetical protein